MRRAICSSSARWPTGPAIGPWSLPPRTMCRSIRCTRRASCRSAAHPAHVRSRRASRSAPAAGGGNRKTRRNAGCTLEEQSGVRSAARPGYSLRKGNFCRAEAIEAHTADITGLQVAQPGAGAARHELALAHAAGVTHHLHQRDRNAERIAGWVATDLLDHRFAVDGERDLELAKVPATPVSRQLSMDKAAIADAIGKFVQQ